MGKPGGRSPLALAAWLTLVAWGLAATFAEAAWSDDDYIGNVITWVLWWIATIYLAPAATLLGLLAIVLGRVNCWRRALLFLVIVVGGTVAEVLVDIGNLARPALTAVVAISMPALTFRLLLRSTPAGQTSGSPPQPAMAAGPPQAWV